MNSSNNYLIPEILNQLFNILFKKYQIISMKDLLSEKLLKKLILEIGLIFKTFHQTIKWA